MNETNAEDVARKVKAGELPAPAKSLAEAVCRVMQHVGYVQKDKQMQGGGSYRYVSVEAVIDALRPEMIRQQLVLLPSKVEPIHQGDHGRQCHLRVRYTFKLLHAASGQAETLEVVGEGMDVGDKAANKAMTAARKYALIMAFNIETGLDPDDTPSRDQERADPEKPAQKPAAPAPKSDPKVARRDNPQLRAEIAAAVDAAGCRADLVAPWNRYEAAIKDGHLGAGDKNFLDGRFRAASAKYPAKK